MTILGQIYKSCFNNSHKITFWRTPHNSRKSDRLNKNPK